MGSLITYSGIATKIKAMERWRISDRQFQEMAALESVPEAVDFLRKIPSYENLFSGLESSQLHRGIIEQQLFLSQCEDFAKLYRFANIKQRHFLDMYFMHYEIQILKACVRNVVGKRPQQELSVFKDFFERHSRLNLTKLSESSSVEDLIGNLKDSPYYGPLNDLLQKGEASLPNCENAIDMLYFRTMWRITKRQLGRKDRKIISQCFGTRMDMLNIQWIYRAKKYYHLTPAQIYAVLIPEKLHLTKSQINRMAEAGSLDEFFAAVKDTWYGSKAGDGLDLENPEALAQEINDRIYSITIKKEPYSIGVLNSYLYFKEREIQKIVTTLESIRYGVSAS